MANIDAVYRLHIVLHVQIVCTGNKYLGVGLDEKTRGRPHEEDATPTTLPSSDRGNFFPIWTEMAAKARKSGYEDRHDTRNGHHSLPETMNCGRVQVAGGRKAKNEGCLRMDRASTVEQIESYDCAASRRCEGSESMTFRGTPPVRFLENERRLLRGRLSGRCQASSPGPNPNQLIRIRLGLRHTQLAGQLRTPPDGVLLFRVAGRWVDRGDLRGNCPWLLFMPPLFDSAVVVEDGQSALRPRRQENSVKRDLSPILCVQARPSLTIPTSRRRTTPHECLLQRVSRPCQICLDPRLCETNIYI